MLAAALVGLGAWTGLIFSIRQMLKVLLRYHGNDQPSASDTIMKC